MNLNGIQHFAQNYICMIFDNIKKFIFPNHCVICDKLLPFGSSLTSEFLCEDCKEKLEFINNPTCKKCGAMINNENETFCIRCQNKFYNSFEYGFGLLRYNDFVKESLHRIKYNNRKEYISFYAKCIAMTYKDKFKDINPEYLIPVPIHKQRLIKRNYNQSSILAHAISDELKKYNIDIPVNENLIFRHKNTKVLNKLDDNNRISELKNAFVSQNNSYINKVIIVDDIYTTGSTINEIADVLKNNGVNKVYFVVISVVDNL